MSELPNVSNLARTRRDLEQMARELTNIIVSSTEPVMPDKGVGWFDPVTLTLKMFDGRDWVTNYISEWIAGALHVPDKTTADSWHVNTDGDMWQGCNEADFIADIENATSYILKDGTAKFKNVTLSTNVTITGLQSGTEIAIQGWQFDGAFSSTDADTVEWASGTLTLLDGSTYSITGADTGNMTALTYIYLDIAVSTTAFQTSTTASAAVGSGKILVAVAQNQTDEATFQVFGGTGGALWTTQHIAANAITANEIVANTITAAKMNVTQLSAIAADLGAITAGTITLTGAGHIKGGQTDFATGTGFFLGWSGDYKFSIGSTTNYLRWDGTYLTLKGSFDVGSDGVINNSVYTVANLPIAPTSVGFNSPSANEY